MAESKETVAWEATVQTAFYKSGNSFAKVTAGDNTNYLGWPVDRSGVYSMTKGNRDTANVN